MLSVTVAAVLAIAGFVNAQSTASVDQYVGYNLSLSGDPNSAVYSTDDVNPDISNQTDPDVRGAKVNLRTECVLTAITQVFLNATVFVGEIVSFADIAIAFESDTDRALL